MTPRLVRASAYGAWKHEWWQCDGHYYVTTWHQGLPVDHVRLEGTAPKADAAMPQKAHCKESA